jgi:hypothetical protein
LAKIAAAEAAQEAEAAAAEHAADLGQCAADVANLIPMTEQTTANTGQAPRQVLAAAGYCSGDNLEAAA